MKLHCSKVSTGYKIVPKYVYDDCSKEDGYYIKGMAGNGEDREMRIVCVLILVSKLSSTGYVLLTTDCTEKSYSQSLTI